MGLVSQTYYAPTEGVSQQPDHQRYETQVTELINGFPDPVRGLQKRPPALYVDVPCENSFEHAHVINRSDEEQYMVVFQDDFEMPIRVFDFNGVEYEVGFADGIQSAAINYLMTRPDNSTATPCQYLKAVTIADYTVILNPNVTTRMIPELTPEAENKALIWVTSAFGTRNNWVITTIDHGVRNTVASVYNGRSFSGGPNDIIRALAWGVNPGDMSIGTTLQNAGLQPIEVAEGMVQIQLLSSTAGLLVTDGRGGGLLKFITSTVRDIADLPNRGPDGFKVHVQGYDNQEISDFWVAFDGRKGIWVESTGPGITTAIDKATMPISLVRQADGTFQIRQIDWEDRVTGDDLTNPIPSFIDNKITNLFFYRNRLGFLSGENVILSKSAEFFNFWFDSAVDLLATDPIDEAVASTSVITLHHAVPQETELILFSEDAQYVLRADGNLTPTSVAIDFVSSYEYDSAITPINISNDIYFISKRGSYSSCYRYGTQADSTYGKFGNDVSLHIPYYITNNVRQFTGNTTENFMAVLVDTEGYENTIIMFNFIIGTDRQFRQQAWHKWTFPNHKRVEFIHFINNFLYINLQTNSGGFEWLRLEMTGDTLDLSLEVLNNVSRTYVDRKVEFNIDDTNAAYDEFNDVTIIDTSKIYRLHVDGFYWLSLLSETPKEEVIPLEEISLVFEGLVDGVIRVGEGGIIRATLLPEDTTQTELVWTVSDPSLATITSRGTACWFNAIVAGTVTVTCTNPESGISASIEVIIEAIPVAYEVVRPDIEENTVGWSIVSYLLEIGYTATQISELNFDVYLLIGNDVYVTGTSGGSALNLSGLSVNSRVFLTNFGYVLGAGGTGSSATDVEDEGAIYGSSGGVGSPAIVANPLLSLFITNEGVIQGGGGGGAAVSTRMLGTDGATVVALQAAGGGGVANGAGGATESSQTFVETTSISGDWTDATAATIDTGGKGGTVTNFGTLSLIGGNGGAMGEAGNDSKVINGVVETVAASGGAAGAALNVGSSVALEISGSGTIGNVVLI